MVTACNYKEGERLKFLMEKNDQLLNIKWKITGNLDYTDELCYDLLGDQNNDNFLLQVFNEAWASKGGIHPRVSLKRSIT